MSWKLISKPQTLQASRKLALEFMEMEPAPNDRHFSERRLMVYQRLLAAGQFRPVTWASAYCPETACTYRVNGKHTSTMLAGLDTLPEFYVVIERYTCDTLEDVAKLYSTFDSKMQSRNANDIYQSFAGTVKELADIPSKSITTAITGMGYCKFGQDLYSKTQPAERAELILEHPDFVIWINGILTMGGVREASRISRVRNSHLYRQPVSAAMFSTYKKTVVEATRFWTAVRDETGTTPNVPDRKLARFLLTLGSPGVKSVVKKKVDTREVYVKCLHAWNAWRNGESTNLNYHANSDVPNVR